MADGTIAMAKALIARQSAHSVQILLSRYARWIVGEGDWAEMNNLKVAPNLPQDSIHISETCELEHFDFHR